MLKMCLLHERILGDMSQTNLFSATRVLKMAWRSMEPARGRLGKVGQSCGFDKVADFAALLFKFGLVDAFFHLPMITPISNS
jgi:hypothetical protein